MADSKENDPNLKADDEEELKENYPNQIDFKPINDGSSNNPSYLILIGDSMLDNFYYQMDKSKQSMTSLFRDKYFNKAMITNLAVEGSESRHVLYGIQPSSQLINERKKYNIEPYPVDADEGNRVYPLAILEEMIASKSIQFSLPKCYLKPTVILSVGMMDIKSLIPISVDSQMAIFSQMSSWAKNLNEILKELIKQRNVNVILVSLTEPYSDFYNLYETPRDAFVMVLDMWMTKLFSIADEWKLPVIDLTRTLNTYDRSHYSALSIFENSNKSSCFIIDLIDFILTHHPFDTASIIYFGSRSYGGIRTQMNDIKARGEYMMHLKNQTAFKQVSKNNDEACEEEKKVFDDGDEEKKVDTNQAQKVKHKAANSTQNDDDNPQKLKATHIILMGDSVIDNFYWLKDRKKDMKQQILDTYKNEVLICNLRYSDLHILLCFFTDYGD